MNKLTLIFCSLLFVAFIGSQSLFTVQESSQAIVLRFGQPLGEVRNPGLHFKTPFIEKVRFFDKRVLAVDPNPEQVVISASKSKEKLPTDSDGLENLSSNQEPLIVDTFLRYRITDPLQFMKTLQTYSNADTRLRDNLSNAVRAELGRTTLETLLSEDRSKVMLSITNRVRKTTQDGNYGIELVDVRIVRTDFAPQLRNSTVEFMRSKFKEQATKTRAIGEEKALKIKAQADRDVVVILAKADREAQEIRGIGDNKATEIYAKAFNKDPEFYKLWRSMQAYEDSLANPQTRLLLSPDTEFLRYFKKGY